MLLTFPVFVQELAFENVQLFFFLSQAVLVLCSTVASHPCTVRSGSAIHLVAGKKYNESLSQSTINVSS